MTDLSPPFLWACRWGQTSALVSSHFIIHGGKTQGGPFGGGYTYTSGPNSAELIALNLSQPFSAGVNSTPPWYLISAEGSNNDSTVDGERVEAPYSSFGTISPMTHRQLLLFGGDGDVAVQTNSDSAYTLQLAGDDEPYLSARWTRAPQSWSQPMRRIYHSAESDGRGGVWVFGGQRDDGSGLVLNQAWSFNHSTSTPSFQTLPQPPGSLVGATSTLLSDGSLLMLGGQNEDGSLQSFDEVLLYDTAQSNWQQIQTRGNNGSSAAVPSPRRGHIAVSLPSQRIFLHGGSPSSTLSSALNDSWILDWSVDPPRWSQVAIDAANGPAPRFGHSAVAYGRNVLLTFGWSLNGVADAGLYVFDSSSLIAGPDGIWSGGQWSNSYYPDPQVIATTSSQSQGGTSGSPLAPVVNNPGGNGASTSNGGTSTGTGGGLLDDSPTVSFGSPDTKSNPDGTQPKGMSNGLKAAAVLVPFVAVALLLTTGYVIYSRRRSNDMAKLRQDSEKFSGGLLLAAEPMGKNGGYPRGGHETSEKSGWYEAAAVGHTKRPAGPRKLSYTKYHSTPTAEPTEVRQLQNIRPAGIHATEGVGPGVRERLSLLTGLNAWHDHYQQAPRFDMLADEDEDEEPAEQTIIYRGRVDSTGEDDDVYQDDATAQPVQEYAHLGESDPLALEDDDGLYGRADQQFTTSPFEDSTNGSPLSSDPLGSASNTASALLASARAALGLSRSFSTGEKPIRPLSLHDAAAHRPELEEADPHTSIRLSRCVVDEASLNEVPNPSLSSSSGSSRSGEPIPYPGPGSIGRQSSRTSFSDAPYQQASSFGRRPSSISAQPWGPSISDGSGSLASTRRSPSWWGKLMAVPARIDRSNSASKLIPTPTADQPIYDPAPPPVVFPLSIIKESPRSMDPSTDSGRFEGKQPEGLDGVGYTDHARAQKPSTRSRGTSTALYNGSRQGPSDSSLASNQSMASSILEAQLREMDVIQRTRTASTSRDPTAATESSRGASEDGSWGRQSHRSLGRALNEIQSSDLLEEYMAEVVSEEPTACEEGPIVKEAGDESQETVHPHATGDDSGEDFQTALGFDKSTVADEDAITIHPRDISDITPLPTRRARQSPDLIARTSLLPRKLPDPPVKGSVKERVAAFEKRRASGLAETANDSGSKESPNSEKKEEKTTAASRVSHGLVPKAQLYVANPDHGKMSSGESR